MGGVEVALCECWGSCINTDGFHESETLVDLSGEERKWSVSCGVTFHVDVHV